MDQRPIVVFLGDSVVHNSYPTGFIGKFAEEYAGKADVLHRGFPFGFDSTAALRYVQDVQRQYGHLGAKMLWVIWMQTNDMTINSVTNLPYTHPDTYAENIARLVRCIRKQQAKNEDGIVVDPPPSSRFSDGMGSNTAAYLQGYGTQPYGAAAPPQGYPPNTMAGSSYDPHRQSMPPPPGTYGYPPYPQQQPPYGYPAPPGNPAAMGRTGFGPAPTDPYGRTGGLEETSGSAAYGGKMGSSSRTLAAMTNAKDDTLLRGATPPAECDIVVIAPAPIDREKWAHTIEYLSQPPEMPASMPPKFLSFEKSLVYAKATVKLGFLLNVPVLDLLLAVPEVNWRGLYEDGVHLNEDGHNLVFHRLKRLIDDSLPNWRAESMPAILPGPTQNAYNYRPPLALKNRMDPSDPRLVKRTSNANSPDAPLAYATGHLNVDGDDADDISVGGRSGFYSAAGQFGDKKGYSPTLQAIGEMLPYKAGDEPNRQSLTKGGLPSGVPETSPEGGEVGAEGAAEGAEGAAEGAEGAAGEGEAAAEGAAVEAKAE
uniref:SGNH hydrolase-type esterase domain-containing protein n=1 Tax=Chromera velia CCMP2878 TaxID=1169474 RepID=A0A0G4H1Q2_9ALVE|eukprot:Cvel_24354.t1-p1 / transcript=Cvel_24354.t1 / gene=Cvel_24354 / organism=Chromera_velia_CCMP2878 / gene_product=hypothetical protein / transcript_product=hypothetical protein / location=Cvel_scaffold2619:18424-23393(-) / protein_length=538 / sequence_SO=supercontig / SO=protein_coding / is_pseudo=false